MEIKRFAAVRAALGPALALVLALALAACVTAPPPAPPPLVVHAVPHKPPAPLDWFHRQLAMARHARATHLPRSDTAGAQLAYYAVMLPACGHIAKVGPEAYRARCRAIVQRASDAAAAAAMGPACPDDEHDDSADDPAQVTACSD
jgi:hypothetical protein